nr:hypothetical protein BgiMline_006372 [Biomphalaria glabrata]
MTIVSELFRVLRRSVHELTTSLTSLYLPPKLRPLMKIIESNKRYSGSKSETHMMDTDINSLADFLSL